MKASEILRNSARLISEKGWVQELFECEDGFCAHGAINEVSYEAMIAEGASWGIREWPYHGQAARALLGAIGVNLYLSIAEWNDEPHRTKYQVLRTMIRAARNLEKNGL